jgi:2-dehydro-3-deoxygluconokinase
MFVTFGASGLRLSPPGRGRLETAATYDVSVTGAASNAAVAAARLGAETVWLSKLPDSPLGRRVVGTLRDHGVDADVVWGDGCIGVRYVEQGAEPRPGAAVDDAASAVVTGVHPDELPLERIRDAQMLYVTGSAMALSTDLVRTTATLLRTASEADVRTAFGLRYREKWSLSEARKTFERLFPAVDVLVAPEADLRHVFERDDDTPREMTHAVGADHDFAQVVLARERGGLVWEGGESATVHEATAPSVRVVDPGGADDAFTGAYLAALLDGREVPEALADAVAVGALTRTTEGDLAITTPAEVRAVRERMAEVD